MMEIVSNMIAVLQGENENVDPGRTRTCNPLIRSQMPYPLGHRTLGSNIDHPLRFDVQQLQPSYPAQNCFIIGILSQLNKSVTPQSSLSQETCKMSSTRTKKSEGIC